MSLLQDERRRQMMERAMASSPGQTQNYAGANPLVQAAQKTPIQASYSNEEKSYRNPLVSAATTQPVQAPQAGQPAPPDARQIAPGIYRSGNSYGDSAEAAISGPRGSGQPSARNMAAADALASRYAGPGMTAQAAQPAQGSSAYIPKDTGGYGLLDKGYRDRRAAMMDAQQFKPGARTALAALLKEQSAQGDREAQASQLASEMDFKRAEGSSNREVEREGQRSKAIVDIARMQAEQRRIDLEESSPERMGQSMIQTLRAQIAQEKDPVARQGLVDHLKDVEGKGGPSTAAPAGFRWSNNGQSLEAIPGGPAAAKQIEDQRTRDSAHDQTRQTIGTINRLMEHPGRQGATGTWNLGRLVPGSNAADFAAEVETLKAQTFLPMVQQLRGMGALSNAEGEKLNAAVGALRFDMSEKAFNESLARIREQFGAALSRSGIDIKDMQSWGLNPDQGQQATKQPQDGQQRAIKRTGTLNGRRVVEYADGSINYAD